MKNLIFNILSSFNILSANRTLHIANLRQQGVYIICVAALALTGCVKDVLHNTPHPDKAKLTVSADWSRRGPGIAVPASWSVAMFSSDTAPAPVYNGTETSETHAPDYLFAPDAYTLVAWNPATDITVSSTTATVATTADGLLCPTPGWLFTSVQEVTIEADRDYLFTARMSQQVRQLTLTIMPIGDSAERMISMECTLTGVAGSMDFAADTYDNESTVPLHFTKITEGENAGAWTATVYLLGITGERQYLSGYATFADGNPQPMPIESDMTEILIEEFDHFNDDKSDPKLLSTWTEVPAQVGFTATITDWEVVDGEEIEIN